MRRACDARPSDRIAPPDGRACGGCLALLERSCDLAAVVGPEGYHCLTKEIDLRQGGQWCFDMIGPDGKVWPNRHRYSLIAPLQRLELLLDDGVDGPNPMRPVVELAPAVGGSQITQTMTFASRLAPIFWGRPLWPSFRPWH